MSKKHPKRVRGFDGSLKKLAKRVGEMRYDKIEIFLQKLQGDLRRQSISDTSAGRVKLGRALQEASEGLTSAQKGLAEAWSISKPYMK